MGDINNILEALLNRKEKICTKSEILKITNEYNLKLGHSLSAFNTLKYLSRHKYIKRIFLGYYYINSIDERERSFCLYDDKELLFIVLNKERLKWYVGMDSALYLAGEIWQVPQVLHIINNRFSGTRRILKLKVKFYRIKESLFFALKEDFINKRIKFYYSNSDKSFLDKFYLKMTKQLIKNKQIKKYIKYYPKWIWKK